MDGNSPRLDGGKEFNFVVNNGILVVEAAYDGDLQKISQLLEVTDDVLPEDDYRVLGLLRAAEGNHDKVVQLILNRCPAIPLKLLSDKVDPDLDITLLHIAAWTGQVKKVRQLKESHDKKPDVNARTKGNVVPLHMAAFHGHLATVNVLLEWSKVELDAVTSEGLTALHMAADCGHADVVQALLTACRKAIAGGMVSGDFINAKDYLHRTALHYASRHGHSAVVKILLSAPEIDVNPEDEVCKFTPLHLAAWMPGDHVEVVKLLIEHKRIQVNARIGAGSITQVALDGKENVPWKQLCPQLVDATVHSSMVFAKEGFPKRGDTPLHLAAEVDNIGVVTELLKRSDIDVNASEDQYGMTALHTAVQWGRNLDVLSKLLSDKGVNVLLKTRGWRFYLDRYAQCDQMSVLHIAAYRGQPDFLGKLMNDLRTGTLFNAKTGNCDFLLNGHHYKGMTCLHIAAFWGHEDIIVKLLSYPKVNVNARTDFHILQNADKCCSDMTVQHTSAYAEHLDVLRTTLSGPEVEESRVNTLMKRLLGPRQGSHVHTLRLFLATSGVEMTAQTRVEALISRLNSNPKVAVVGDTLADFKGQHYADKCYSQMTPLHVAAHRGQLEVLIKMLSSPFLELNAQTGNGDTVLHIAIRERRLHVIKEVCAQRKLQANMKNLSKERALQMVWYEWQEAMDCLLERKDVRMFMDRMFQDKQSFHNAANALIVGGSLIASVTFGGFLQPPLGAAFNTYRGWAVRSFWTFNNLSFFFAVYTLVLSIRIVMPKPEHFIEKEVKKLRRGIAFTSTSLTISTAFVIGAFITAGMGNLPPNTMAYMLVSSILGGLFILLFAGIPLIKDYLDWFNEVTQQCWRHPTPGARGAVSDITAFLTTWLRKTFSRRKKVKTVSDISSQTPQEAPPGPSEKFHPHRTLRTSPPPTIFHRESHLKTRPTEKMLMRQIGPIGHRRFPSL